MPRIWTPIPQYWVQRWREYWRQALITRLWQFSVGILGLMLIITAATSTVGFVAIVGGMVASVILADDIRQTVRDIWYRNFWVFRP